MKHLILGSLLAISVAGCGGGGTSGNTITAAWTFKDLATSVTTGCPTGFDTAEIVAQEVDAVGNQIGAQVISKFHCAALGGTTLGLPEGLYDVFVDITDGGNNVFATSLLNSVDISITDGSIPDQVILNDGGYFHVAWTLVGATTGHTLTCAEAGSPGAIEIISTLGGMVFDDKFPCATGDGLTDGLPTGTYGLQIRAETNGSGLGTATALTKDILDANRVTELGAVTINIDGL